MKKQTAVSLLVEKLFKKGVDTTRFIPEIEQALEMEKQQTIDFANDLLAQNDKNYIAVPDLAEQYYKETYED